LGTDPEKWEGFSGDNNTWKTTRNKANHSYPEIMEYQEKINTRL